MTEYVRPSDLDAALEARDRHPEYAIIAGCTDFMVGLCERERPAGVIDVFGLQGLDQIREDSDRFHIGAATTYAALLRHPGVTEKLPGLVAAVREIGAVQIQERGTIGGNIATSSPVGDTLPVLLALDAEIEVASVRGTRTIPYESFCTGYRQIALAPDELIVTVRIPIPHPGSLQYWRKVGTRRAQAISKIMAAGRIFVEDETVQEVRWSLGAVADRPIRVENVESYLLGKAIDPYVIAEVTELQANAIQPIDDVRSTARYRSRVAGNLLAQFLRGAVSDVPT